MDHTRLIVRRLGLQAYAPVWRAMQEYTEGRDEASLDQIWLLQHPPVYTQGRNGKAEHLLDTGDIPVVQIDRGGQVTYHGPGQLVLYTLIDLKRLKMGVREMVSILEQAVIQLLAEHGITAEPRADAPGVYVEGAKVAALGLRVRQGRCYHGLSLNLDMDLAPFARINPCGYRNLAVKQLAELTTHWHWQAVEHTLCQNLAAALGYTQYQLHEGMDNNDKGKMVSVPDIISEPAH